jgi:hypothetical protein
MTGHTMTFDDACMHAATQLYVLRQRVERRDLFDEAVEQMQRDRYRVDIQTGVVRNKAGFVSRFVDYDWASQYEEAPHFIFYDFFQGILMNSYARKLAGV